MHAPFLFNGNAFLNIVILYYLLMRRDVWFANHLVMYTAYWIDVDRCIRGRGTPIFEVSGVCSSGVSWGVHSVRLHPGGSKRGAKKEGRKRKKQGKGEKKRERKGAPKKERREGKENMQKKRKRGKKSKENRI